MPKNNKKAINSVPYTKAGLLNKSSEKSNKGEDKTNEPAETDLSENPSTISKGESIKRDSGTPLH